MKKFILACFPLVQLLLCFCPTAVCAEEILTRQQYGTEAYRYEYVGKDTIGGDWYLDKQDIYFDENEDDIVDFYIETTIKTTSPYRQKLLEWIADGLNNHQKAFNIINRTSKMSQQYIWDIEQSLYCMKGIFLYDANQELLYHYSYSAFGDWYPVASNPIIVSATEWIRKVILSSRKIAPAAFNTTTPQPPIKTTDSRQGDAPSLNQQHTAKPTNNHTRSQTISVNHNTNNLDALSIILLTLIGGVFTSIVLVVAYNHLTSTKSFSATSTQDTPEINHDSSNTSDKAEYDFDYPHEDIGKVTGI